MGHLHTRLNRSIGGSSNQKPEIHEGNTTHSIQNQNMSNYLHLEGRGCSRTCSQERFGMNHVQHTLVNRTKYPSRKEHPAYIN